MTAEEQVLVEQAVVAAWEAGFHAARHWPNHQLPVLRLDCGGAVPKPVPDWDHRKPGYVG